MPEELVPSAGLLAGAGCCSGCVGVPPASRSSPAMRYCCSSCSLLPWQLTKLFIFQGQLLPVFKLQRLQPHI